MKTLKSIITLVLLFVLLTPVFGQNTYKGLPLLHANSSKVNARIGSLHVNGLWTIKPQYNPNTLQIEVTGQKQRLVLYTDIDSAVYELRPARSEHFYVLLNKEHYVFTEVKGFKRPSEHRESKLLDIAKPQSKVFGSLWEKHQIGEAVDGINDYAEKVSGAVNWVKDKLSSN